MAYIVMTASAKMPASVRGRYARVAVVELDPDHEGMPAMISERARGVRRIVETWERCHVGRTARCAYQRALAEAETLAAELNTARG